MSRVDSISSMRRSIMQSGIGAQAAWECKGVTVEDGGRDRQLTKTIRM